MKIDVRMRGAMMSRAGVLGNIRMLSRGVARSKIGQRYVRYELKK